jgi:hypothetical protein
MMGPSDVKIMLEDWARDALDGSEVSARVEILVLAPPYPQTSGEYQEPAAVSLQNVGLRVSFDLPAGFGEEAAVLLRRRAAAHLRRRLEEDSTLGGRVLPPERVLPEFEDEAEALEVVAHLHVDPNS